MPKRWKLFEYNMAGLLTNVLSFDKEMSKYHVLAWNMKDPIFLMTPYGPNYINELHVRRITGSEESLLHATVKLKDIYITRTRGWL